MLDAKEESATPVMAIIEKNIVQAPLIVVPEPLKLYYVCVTSNLEVCVAFSIFFYNSKSTYVHIS